jgi:2-polyprenyl-6-methoxyphenol hydroxylase-like FAD-dependent oxidoreductase
MTSVLISGAAIAGPTLAFWLKAAGFEPTIVERSPGLRTGGYVIDFWGLGYDLAERMGLFGEINRTGYHVRAPLRRSRLPVIARATKTSI